MFMVSTHSSPFGRVARSEMNVNFWREGFRVFRFVNYKFYIMNLV